jgi:hypothetical protein
MSGQSLKDDPKLSLRLGGRTVGENLQNAVDAGAVVVNADGSLELAERGPPAQTVRDYFIGHAGEFKQPCSFLNAFLFKNAYAQSTVPFGCRNCYKVKIVSDNLRQLVAVKDIIETTPYTAKSGVEAETPNNQTIYSSYVYNLGLDRARAAYRDLRNRIEAKLGSKVKMLIKRGCTNYEHSCGPSDRYTFDPRLDAVEAYLAKRFRNGSSRLPALSKAVQDRIRLINMIGAAFRLGDDTYKDFTGGKTLFRPVVTYSPEPEDEQPENSTPDAA